MYKRAQAPGERAQMDSAQCADVPQELIVGACARAAERLAMRAADEENTARLHRAIERAQMDGRIILSE